MSSVFGLSESGTDKRTDTRGFVPEKTHRMLRTIIIIIITTIIITSGGSDDTAHVRRYVSAFPKRAHFCAADPSLHQTGFT
ncbi:hypothetical protein PDJAM_G00073830 [Pangasius djambal]|uniref:Uncharacterized protein n=1 Tax=Pangasius djambal TaxID=1691987 RepID=A0ACC5Z1G0_9TELE|nr:hypothetical protein [Pangasius djambal]